MIDAYGITDKGKRRKDNEDSLLLNEELALFIIADGMGGHMQGEVASKMAVGAINKFIEKHIENGSHLEQDHYISELLKAALHRANKEIYDYSRGLAAQDVMGTTVSLALVRDSKMYLAHVGDSCIYRARDGRLEKLTKDHSVVQQLIDTGELTSEEAKSHKLKHALTKAVGTAESVEPDKAVFDTEAGDSVLLSTDGLMKVLDEEGIKRILLQGNSAEEKCRRLVHETLAGGAPDNVSVIVADFK